MWPRFYAGLLLAFRDPVDGLISAGEALRR